MKSIQLVSKASVLRVERERLEEDLKMLEDIEKIQGRYVEKDVQQCNQVMMFAVTSTATLN